MIDNLLQTEPSDASESPAILHQSPGHGNDDLLERMVNVWGYSVGLDESTAMALILTIVGGVAGNSVRINLPRVGDLGADLQIAVERDRAPALRRGMQRLVGGFESAILMMLNEYEHLSSKRAQKQELALLESELSMLIKERDELATLLRSDRSMIDMTMKGQAEQAISRLDAVVARLMEVERRANALHFRIRPMVMVQELGVDEIGAVPEYAFDNALLEVVANPGYLGRIALMPDRWLYRLASFRRSSGWSARLEFSQGAYRRRSSISTVLMADGNELINAWADRMIAATGLLDETLVCIPGPSVRRKWKTKDPGDEWSSVVSRLFSARIEGGIRMFRLTEEAERRFERARGKLLKLGSGREGSLAALWREYGPALVAKLALCVALIRERGDGTIHPEDVEVAMSLGMSLLESTTRHRERVDQYISARRRPGRNPQAPIATVPESPTARMVSKLKRIGPCTMRTLFRSYPRADYQVLEPILERAVELGFVERNGKLLKVANSGEGADDVAN